MGYTVSSIFTAVDKFSAPLDRMQSKLSKFGGASADAAARIERRFNAVSRSASDLAVKTGAGALAIALPLGMAVKSASDFESKLSNVSTLVDTSKESMSLMGESVLAVAKKIPKPVDELVTSLYDIRSAGISAENAMATLNTAGKLSVAGLSSASEATNILTSAMNAFSSEGLNSDQISDILFKTVKAGKTTVSELSQAFGSTAPMIQSAGVSLADFQAATAALTTVGTPASQAQNQLRASIVALQKPTAEMDKIFKKLGVSGGNELIKKYGSLGASFEAVNKQGTSMGINLAKAWSSTEASAAVTSILGATNTSYVATLKDMTMGANLVEAAFDKQSKTTSSQTQLMKNNLEALSITVGTQLVPFINEVIPKLIEFTNKISDFIKENPNIIKMVAVFGLLLAVMSGISTVVAVVSTFIATLASLHGAFMVIGGLVSNWIIPMFQVIGAIIIGIVEIVAGMMGVTVGVFAAIAVAVLAVVGIFISLYNHWDMITAAFKNGGIIGGLKAIGATLLDVILYPLQKILEAASSLPDFLGGGFAKSGAMGIEQMRADMGLTEIPKAESTKVETAKRTETNTNKNVTFDFKNVPKGMIIGGGTDIANSIMPNMGSTMGF